MNHCFMPNLMLLASEFFLTKVTTKSFDLQMSCRHMFFKYWSLSIGLNALQKIFYFAGKMKKTWIVGVRRMMSSRQKRLMTSFFFHCLYNPPTIFATITDLHQLFLLQDWADLAVMGCLLILQLILNYLVLVIALNLQIKIWFTIMLHHYWPNSIPSPTGKKEWGVGTSFEKPLYCSRSSL